MMASLLFIMNFRLGMIVENGKSRVQWEVIDEVKPGYVLFKRLSDGERALALNPIRLEDGTICWDCASYYGPEARYFIYEGACYRDYELHFIDNPDRACVVETDRKTYDRFKLGDFFVEDKKWFKFSFNDVKMESIADTDIYLKEINKYFHLENCSRMDESALFLHRLMKNAYSLIPDLMEKETDDEYFIRQNFAYFIGISRELRRRVCEEYGNVSVLISGFTAVDDGFNYIFCDSDEKITSLIGTIMDLEEFVAYDFRIGNIVTLDELVKSNQLEMRKVLIEETLSRIVSVYAVCDDNDALDCVSDAYRTGNIILDGDDLSEITISNFMESEERTCM